MVFQAKYKIGHLVKHRFFCYRAVVVDADPCYQGTEEWYELINQSDNPARDEPWYHVMIDGALQTTYVPERLLQLDEELTPIKHPKVDKMFLGFDGYGYVPQQNN